MKKINFFCIALLLSIGFGTLTAYACESFLGNTYVDCYLESTTPGTEPGSRASECNYQCYCNTGNEDECHSGMAQLGLTVTAH
jgi:uncharacterized protein YxeA